MTSSALSTAPSVVDSSQAISASAKEKIRMQAQRYQRGSLSILKRKSQPDAWMFRYYAEENGRRVYKRQYVGTVLEFPKRRDAEKALTQLRVEINEGQYTPMNIAQLVVHYKRDEPPRKAFATVVSYTAFLDSHIVPKWCDSALSAIKSIEVEKWLDGTRGRTASRRALRRRPRSATSCPRCLPMRFTMGGHRKTRSQRSGRQPSGCAIRNFSRRRNCRRS